MAKRSKFILWFDQLRNKDVGLVGGKNASLGEMHSTLARLGINVPYGFAVTAAAYRYLLKKAGLEPQLRKLLRGLNVKNISALKNTGRQCRELIANAELPEKLQKDVLNAYAELCKKYRMKNLDVAVRSSATAEDLPTASFAGQQETFLNVRGDKMLLRSCLDCFASLFTDRAIVYRAEKGFSHFKVALSIGVQKMVRSDKASSGVMFTLDTETGFKDAVFITGSYGLGENIVQGKVNPDEFIVFKPTLLQGFKPIVSKTLGEKKIMLRYEVGGVCNHSVPQGLRNRFCLSDNELLQLARWGILIEQHYSRLRKQWTPMDIEWAKDGVSGRLFIVQARPETVQSQKKANIVEEYYIIGRGKCIVRGKSVGSKIGHGKANIIKSVKDIGRFKAGEVLVTEMTDPDWVPVMKTAAAIVTDKGGRSSHAAIVSRELGIPCIVGTNHATKKIKHGQTVTVSCEGEAGCVYAGFVKYGKRRIDTSRLPETKTKIMINIGQPDEAFEYSFLPNDGVGLARIEFIITDSIKIHPMALVEYAKLKDAKVKRRIDRLTKGFKDKTKFYVDRLAQGIGTIASAFYPKPVIVRTSDFKSNEYANLRGGKFYEPVEENPMLGFRGAVRYYSGHFRPAFELECRAFRKVREEFGLKNVKIMIPMCRTVEEGRKVIEIMKRHGLKQGRDGLEVYVMCELPANVILADEFAKLFDGFSIGSNDLTQTTLGVDRDSALISHLFDERNEAVKRMAALAIKTVKKYKKKIGICGDAPSTYPDFARFLVKCGIDSISLSPDAVVRSRIAIAKEERRIKR